mmetsp:Transcript_47287/g.137674  ORF Transcript_47287/g.137674 Transcript_47287/m.137674 type:complete len:279 (+) Transcript_47287:708-1544(+)
MQARFNLSQSCCRWTSFLLLSCSATWWRDIFNLFGDPRDLADGGGGVLSKTACMLRSVDRKHISSTLSACNFCSMSCRTSSSAWLSSATIALDLFAASERRRWVSMRTAFSSSSAISTLSRTCSRRGRFSRCSRRQAHNCNGASLSRRPFSTKACEVPIFCTDASSDSALFWSFSSKRYEFLTLFDMLLCKVSYMLMLSHTTPSWERLDVSICLCALYCAALASDMFDAAECAHSSGVCMLIVALWRRGWARPKPRPRAARPDTGAWALGGPARVNGA